MVYRRGVDNGVADALSRRQPSETLMAVSAPSVQWLSSLQEWYVPDPEASALLTQLAVDSVARPPFSLHQGLIRYKNKIWLGSYSAFATESDDSAAQQPRWRSFGLPSYIQQD